MRSMSLVHWLSGWLTTLPFPFPDPGRKRAQFCYKETRKDFYAQEPKLTVSYPVLFWTIHFTTIVNNNRKEPADPLTVANDSLLKWNWRFDKLFRIIGSNCPHRRRPSTPLSIMLEFWLCFSARTKFVSSRVRQGKIIAQKSRSLRSLSHPANDLSFPKRVREIQKSVDCQNAQTQLKPAN